MIVLSLLIEYLSIWNDEHHLILFVYKRTYLYLNIHTPHYLVYHHSFIYFFCAFFFCFEISFLLQFCTPSHSGDRKTTKHNNNINTIHLRARLISLYIIIVFSSAFRFFYVLFFIFDFPHVTYFVCVFKSIHIKNQESNSHQIYQTY